MRIQLFDACPECHRDLWIEEEPRPGAMVFCEADDCNSLGFVFAWDLMPRELTKGEWWRLSHGIEPFYLEG